jgi:hypothetical protein
MKKGFNRRKGRYRIQKTKASAYSESSAVQDFELCF